MAYDISVLECFGLSKCLVPLASNIWLVQVFIVLLASFVIKQKEEFYMV